MDWERKEEAPSIPQWDKAEQPLRSTAGGVRPAVRSGATFWSGLFAFERQTAKIKWADRHLWEEALSSQLKNAKEILQ